MRRHACRVCQSALQRAATSNSEILLHHVGGSSKRWQHAFSKKSGMLDATRSSATPSSARSTSSASSSSSSSESQAAGSALPDFLRSPLSASAASASASGSAIPSTSSSSASSSSSIFDPLQLVGNELSSLRSNVQKLLGSGHPSLDTIAKYYFQAEGKHIRPMIVLLMSQATNGLAPGFSERQRLELSGAKKNDPTRSIDDPLETRRDDILNDSNPSAPSFSSTFDSIPSTSNVLPSQRRLAEITEMIHVASLLHDDVIDAASTRRSQSSAPAAFGNKLSILGGDFLLARASLYLSRLGSNEVVEIIASVYANLVEGEVMQFKGNAPESDTEVHKLTPEIFQHYMKKTYLKTASLIAKSARATTVLGGAGEKEGWVEGEYVKDIAYSYGRNLGIAFQVSGLIGSLLSSIDWLLTRVAFEARRRSTRLYSNGRSVR